MNFVTLRFYLLLLMSTGSMQGSIDSYQFDVNDILDEKYMPAHLLIKELDLFAKNSNIARKGFYDENHHNCSDFTAAFSTMRFHRKMMNKYLATNFLTKKILKEFPEYNTVLMERRIGEASLNTTEKRDTVQENHRKGKYVQNDLLEDAGSKNYRSWLDKTTTLEDIHRQFGKSVHDRLNGFKQFRNLENERRKSDFDDDLTEDEDFDAGDITGYAYSGGTSDTMSSYPALHHLSFDATNNIPQYQPQYPAAGSKNGYYPPTGHEPTYDGYRPLNHIQQHPQQPVKEIGLKDILDIALTTLAFLSFGMFILQILMCITMNKDDSSNMMMMPMESPDAFGLPAGNSDVEEIRRRKRNLQRDRRMEMMNELSRRVLISIDAVLQMPQDNGVCHYRWLCENNKFARKQKVLQKTWMPLWSLGMSWFSSKLHVTNATTDFPILESLKATVVGIGDGDCSKMYKSCRLDSIIIGKHDGSDNKKTS